MDGIDVGVVDVGRHVDVVRGVDKVVQLDDCGDVVAEPDWDLNLVGSVTVPAFKDNSLPGHWGPDYCGRTKATARRVACLTRLTVGHTVIVFVWA